MTGACDWSAQAAVVRGGGVAVREGDQHGERRRLRRVRRHDGRPDVPAAGAHRRSVLAGRLRARPQPTGLRYVQGGYELDRNPQASGTYRAATSSTATHRHQVRTGAATSSTATHRPQVRTGRLRARPQPTGLRYVQGGHELDRNPQASGTYRAATSSTATHRPQVRTGRLRARPQPTGLRYVQGGYELDRNPQASGTYRAATSSTATHRPQVRTGQLRARPQPTGLRYAQGGYGLDRNPQAIRYVQGGYRLDRNPQASGTRRAATSSTATHRPQVRTGRPRARPQPTGIRYVQGGYKLNRNPQASGTHRAATDLTATHRHPVRTALPVSVITFRRPRSLFLYQITIHFLLYR